MLQDVREFYFEDKRVGLKTSSEYIRMISDLNFDYPCYKSTKLHIQHGRGNAFSMRYVFVCLLLYLIKTKTKMDAVFLFVFELNATSIFISN